MKAQRRQQLKANSLIWHLQGLPELIRRYQSQIALVVLLIALVIVMIRYRITAAEARLAEAQQSLSLATEDFGRLQSFQYFAGSDPAEFNKRREEFFSDGLEQADDAFQKAPDSQHAIKAEALKLKGDINFELANAPELPGAATQPSHRPSESVDTLLNDAGAAYNQILQDYPDQMWAVVAAHFGLAAIAEDRAATDGTQWDAAKAQYRAIIDSGADEGYKKLATGRIALLAQLQHPATVNVSAATQAGLTQSASTQPASTQPAVMGPAVPATQK
jgi:hypothetical protein